MHMHTTYSGAEEFSETSSSSWSGGIKFKALSVLNTGLNYLPDLDKINFKIKQYFLGLLHVYSSGLVQHIEYFSIF